MKKLLILMSISLLLLVAACSDTTGSTKDEQSKNSDPKSSINEKKKEKEDLTLQLLKKDEEAGETIEANPIYQMANDVIKENPKLGDEDNFTMYLVDSLSNDTGDRALLFLAINRFPHSMENVTFDFTVGNETDGYVWNKLKVTLPASNIGVIDKNGAVPIVMPIKEEQYTKINELAKGKLDIKIENFKYDKVE